MTTFVFIHGAYQGGWIWQHVAARLGRRRPSACSRRRWMAARNARHAVRPGITTETHAEEIAELLFFEDLHDVVLVGTSSGGMVLCKAAELARDRVTRLVFADALALFDGECIPDIVNRVGTVDHRPHHRPVEARTPPAGMFASLDGELKEWTLARYTPHPDRGDG